MKTANSKISTDNTGKHSKPIKTLLLTSLLTTTLTTLVACGGGSDTNSGSSNSNNSSEVDNNTDDNSNDNSNDNSGDNNTGGGTDTDKDLIMNANVAQNFVDNLATPAFKTFATDSQALANTIQGYCVNIGTNTENSDRLTAQHLWLDLETQWQASKIYHVGVLADDYGKLAKNIYTSNFLETGAITAINDQVALYKANSSLVISDKTTFNIRGLDTLEYLLFDDTANNKDSCSYAVLVAENVAENAKTIEKSWIADRDNLLTTTTSNGVDLVQPFFDNVITLLDKDIKDADLGVPLGVKISGSCDGVCTNKVEHNISHSSYASIKANLQNIKDVFVGKFGFKAYYDSNNMDTEAQRFVNNIDIAINTINAQDKSLFAQLQQIKSSNKENACATVATTGVSSDIDLAPCQLYYQVKQISDDVKTGSFKLAINLDLPASAAGDGD